MADQIVVLEPAQTLALKAGVWLVERGTGGQSNTVTYHGYDGSKSITYADDAAAIAALVAWQVALDPPIPAPIIQPGDVVQVSMNDHAKGALGQDFDATVVALPTAAAPYWIVRTITNATTTMYLTNVAVSKRT